MIFEQKEGWTPRRCRKSLIRAPRASQGYVRVFVVLIGLLLYAATAWAWSAKVVGITDGDTVTVLRPGNVQVKIRLYGIDTPERKQAFGTKAKNHLGDLIHGKQVEIIEMDTDRYGRTVALIEHNGLDVNGEMVKAGLAWVYTKYCESVICYKWKTWEVMARMSGDGLWADKHPIPPWEWRKKKK